MMKPDLMSSECKELDSSAILDDALPEIVTLKVVLADEYTQNVQKEAVFVAKIINPKSTSQIINNLNKFYPLPSLHHLKRIRSVRDSNSLSLSVVLDTVRSRNLEEFKAELISNGFDKLDVDVNVTVVEVSCTPPRTRKQFEEASLLWPCNFREDKYLESLLSNNYFSCEALKTHTEFMREAIGAAEESVKIGGSGIGAVVVNPNTCKRVAVGLDCRHAHPLQHAIMVVIDQVAKSQGGGAWESNEKCWFDKTLVQESDACNFQKGGRKSLKRSPSEMGSGGSSDLKNEVAKTGPYLCTGYDVYVTREPCMMCAMALVHSRAHRIFYGCANPAAGALGSLHKLHTKKELNHHYEVFCGLLEKECKVLCENR